MIQSSAYAILKPDMKQGRGYTILEVLIFLAISGFMLFAAMIAIGGRQQDIQFAQATRDFENKINDYISDVEVGYFDRDERFSCGESATPRETDVQYSATGPSGPVDQPGVCVLSGKVIVMADEGSISSNPTAVADKSKLRIINMVSLRLNELGRPANSVAESLPRPLIGDADYIIPTYDLQYGLEIEKVVLHDDANSTNSIEAAGVLAIMNNASAGTVADDDVAAEAGSTSTKVVMASFDAGQANAGINELESFWRVAGDGKTSDFTDIAICMSGPNARGNGPINWLHKETAVLVVSRTGNTQLILDGAERYCDV